MKFSFVTASYNQGRYIRDCIDSVRSQPDVEWEHLVQDAACGFAWSLSENGARLCRRPAAARREHAKGRILEQFNK